MKNYLEKFKNLSQRNRIILYSLIGLVLALILFLILFTISNSSISNSLNYNSITTTVNPTQYTVIPITTVVTTTSVNPTPTPTLPPYQNGDMGFGFYKNNLYFRSQDIEYTVADGTTTKLPFGQYSYKAGDVKTPSLNTINWYSLGKIPQGAINTKAPVDVWLQKSQNNNSSIISLSWNSDINGTYSKNYYYDSQSNVIQDISSWLNTNNDKISFIELLDPTGLYGLFTVSDCTGDCIPSIRVANFSKQTSEMKSRVSYFKWLENGNYEYKDYIPDCTGVIHGTCPSKDPNLLPLKTGKI